MLCFIAKPLVQIRVHQKKCLHNEFLCNKILAIDKYFQKCQLWITNNFTIYRKLVTASEICIDESKHPNSNTPKISSTSAALMRRTITCLLAVELQWADGENIFLFLHFHKNSQDSEQLHLSVPHKSKRQPSDWNEDAIDYIFAWPVTSKAGKQRIVHSAAVRNVIE